MRTFRRYKEKANDPHVPFIQPKLSIGKLGDKHEVEADAMADKVVNSTTSQGAVQKMESTEEDVQQKPLAASITPLIQKQSEASEEENVQAKCADCDQEEKVQRMEEEENVQRMEEEEEAVQTKPEGKNNASPKVESSLKNSKGNGRRMSKSVKNDMESGFGADFSQVKIHTDDNAVQMNKQLKAQAFTHGNDVYFNQGKYNPSSAEGKHLLAHELTHTIQQKGMQNKSPYNNSLNGRIMTYRKGGENFRGCDTATLKEKRYQKGDPWIDTIDVNFNSVKKKGEDYYPKGTAVGKYHGNELPNVSTSIAGGWASAGISDKGNHKVLKIKGCGYHSSRSPEIPKKKRLKKGSNRYFKPEFAGSSSMSFAIFFSGLQALHMGDLDHGSLSCIHIPNTSKMQQLNYHSRIGITKVNVKYDSGTLLKICCERAKHKGYMVSNPCGGLKMKDCP